MRSEQIWEIVQLQTNKVVFTGSLVDAQAHRQVMVRTFGIDKVTKCIVLRPYATKPPVELCSICSAPAVARVAYPSYPKPIGRCLRHLPEIHKLPTEDYTNYSFEVFNKLIGTHKPSYTDNTIIDDESCYSYDESCYNG